MSAEGAFLLSDCELERPLVPKSVSGISDTLPSGLSLTESMILEPPATGKVGVPPTLVDDLRIHAGRGVSVSLSVTVSTDVRLLQRSPIPPP